MRKYPFLIFAAVIFIAAIAGEAYHQLVFVVIFLILQVFYSQENRKKI